MSFSVESLCTKGPGSGVLRCSWFGWEHLFPQEYSEGELRLVGV